MTQVDFYILPASSLEQRLEFSCRLTEKAYQQGRHVYIHTENMDMAKQIDQALWQFRAESFVPHALLEHSTAPGTAVDHPTDDSAHYALEGQSNSAPVPVAIGHGDTPHHHDDVLINLATGIPDFFGRFQRVAEVVVQDPAVLKGTRSNYAFYKERGYPLKTNDLR